MKKFNKLILFIIIILIMFSISTIVYISHADMGDYSGDADYGGSDYSSSYGGGDYSSDDDYGGSDYYSSSDGDSSSSEADDGDVIAGIFAFIFVVVIFIVAVNYNKKKIVVPGAAATDYTKLNKTEDYKRIDPDFSENLFKEKISNLYVQMQNCWQAKDIDQLRPYFTDVLYNQFDRQLEAYRINKQTNCIENICVLSVDIMGWTQDEVHDIMILRLKTRIRDYVVNDITNIVIRGSKTQEKFMDYEWSLIRKTGIQTHNKEGITSLHCASCGAPMDVNQSSKCPYCGTVMTTSDYDWVISAIKGISQRTS